MKRFMMVLTAAAVLMTTAAFAEDGAAIFKAKCAACHGAAGEGKGAAPAIKGKSLDVVTKGGAKGIHAKPIAGVTPEQVAAIAAFLK